MHRRDFTRSPIILGVFHTDDAGSLPQFLGETIVRPCAYITSNTRHVNADSTHARTHSLTRAFLDQRWPTPDTQTRTTVEAAAVKERPRAAPAILVAKYLGSELSDCKSPISYLLA